MRLTIFNFWPGFEMKLQKLWIPNMKAYHISNEYACVSYDKQSDGCGHWNTAHGESFNKSLEMDWVLRRRKKIWFEHGNKMTDWTNGESFVIIPDRVAWESRSEECWSCGAFLTVTTSCKGRLGRASTKDLEDLLRWRCSFELTEDLSLIPWVFKLGSSCRVKPMIGNWTTPRLRLAFLSC
jgi:hypothetical protein